MRAFYVFWRLFPFVVLFFRDRRRWILTGGRRGVSEVVRKDLVVVDGLR